MKKLVLFLSLFVVAVVGSANVQRVCEQVDLTGEIIDPTVEGEPIEKGPMLVPSVSLEGYTLSFITPCNGCTLRLLDENDNVVYTTVISSSTLVLPSTLSGEYKIEIISGNYLFWGYIYL